MSRLFDESTAIEVLGALAQATRLAVFRQLVVAHPEPIPAGEVAAACGVPHNTMSTHLAILSRAGLITSERQGRSILYRADLDGFRRLIAFLIRDCCHGRAEICAPVLEPLLNVCPCEPEATHG